MKRLLLCLLLLPPASTLWLHEAGAQSARKQKQLRQAAALQQQLGNRRFVFHAEYVTPQGGSTRLLTRSFYDLTLAGDSLVSNLPYFGRAYSAAAVNIRDVGLKFISTNFEYSSVSGKRNSWQLTILPKDNPNISRIFLTIQQNGTAYLQINSISRDPISYTGYVD